LWVKPVLFAHYSFFQTILTSSSIRNYFQTLNLMSFNYITPYLLLLLAPFKLQVFLVILPVLFLPSDILFKSIPALIFSDLILLTTSPISGFLDLFKDLALCPAWTISPWYQGLFITATTPRSNFYLLTYL
jgi:hypothetical protein